MSKLGRWARNTIVGLGLAAATILPSHAQTHELDFKVRELTHGQGANISQVKVDIDDGSYIAFTDTNGVAHIPGVNDGTHSIKMSKNGYIQFLQNGYTLSSNQTFNASIPKQNRVGAWGTDTLNPDEYREVFKTLGTTIFNIDPARWKQIAPIFNQLVPGSYTQADSLLLVQAINEVESKTGYNLITLVSGASSDTVYNIKLNSNNTSYAWSNENFIYTGLSNIGHTLLTRRMQHEFVMQFDMHPGTLTYPSVMDDQTQTQVNMTSKDADHIALTFDEHNAKARGEQDMFLGNMQNYVAPITPVQTTNTKPANGSNNLDAAVEIAWNNISGADKYRVNIATDSTFSNMIADLIVNRNDTIITLQNGKTYFMRVDAQNIAGNAPQSNTTSFSTKSITPGNTSITTPTVGATGINTPVHFVYTASTNATQYNLEISLANDFSTLVTDTTLFGTSADISFSRHTKGYARVRGENPSQGTVGNWSNIEEFTSINDNPLAPITNTPSNGATLNAENYSNGQLILKYTTTNRDTDNDTITTTFIVSGPGVNKTFTTTIAGQITQTIDSLLFQPNTTYNTTIKADDGYGGITNGVSTTFKTATAPIILPGTTTITNPTNNATKIAPSVQYNLTPATNATLYEIIVAIDSAFTNKVIDTTVNDLNPIIKLDNGITYYSKASGKNINGNGPWTGTIKYTIIKASPGQSIITNPTNNETEVVQPITFTSNTATNTEQYRFRIFNQDNQLVLDTTLNKNNFQYNKLATNRTHTIMVQTSNSDVTGNWSPIIKFTTYDNAPTININQIADSVDSKKGKTFEWTANDIDKDSLTYSERIWNTNQDTTIYNITKQSYNLEGFLKPQQTYNWTITARDGKKETTSEIGTFNTINTVIEEIILNKEDFAVYPNPMRENATVRFNLKERSNVEIKLYDMVGKMVRQYNMPNLTPDQYEAPLSGENLPTGMYIVTVKAGNETETKKIIKE